MKISFLSIILFSIASSAFAQRAAIIKFPELERMMNRQTDTTYVINFFATWCEPCVHEFPLFQQLSKQSAGQKVKVVFVSLDFRKEFEKRLVPFLKTRHVREEVVLLDEPDYNSWIDKVDSSWSGDLPATLIVNNRAHRRAFFSKEFTLPELMAAVKPFLP